MALRSTAPAAPVAPPEPPILDGYPDKGDGLQVVTLVGLLLEPTTYRVGTPLPIDLNVGGDLYTLSDRAAGLYNFRHK